MSSTFCFQHLDPDGTPHSYTKEQNAEFAGHILAQPKGGTLAVPGYEGKFELRWGDQAYSWKCYFIPAKSGIYQVNVASGLSNGNTRDVVVVEGDAWKKATRVQWGRFWERPQGPWEWHPERDPKESHGNGLEATQKIP